MSRLLQDFRYALRVLAKNPGLTIAAVLSLAIGIGANTAIFSVTNGLLLRPLPYPHPDRLALIWLHSPGLGILQDWPSPGQFLDLRQQNKSFEEMAIVQGFNMTLTGRDEPQRIGAFFSSSNFFPMVGAKAELGRLLLPEDDQPGKQPVAILSHGLWKRMFGGDPNIINKTATLNNRNYVIAGVLPADFLLNHEIIPTVGGIDNMEIFLPLPLPADAQTTRRGDENYNLLVRLKPGVSLTTAQADVDVIASRIREQDKRDPTFGMSVVPLLDQVVGNVKRAVLVLLGSVTLVLLVACANVANLLLARAAGRAKEVAVRAALGAARGRLIRQLLTEAVALSAIGGALGLAIAWGALQVIRAINPGNIPRLDQIGLDPVVLGFTFAVSLVTGIVFGLAPALRISCVDLNTALKAGGRTGETDGGLLARHGLRGLLVVAELGLCLMLLVGAGLLIRSFVRLASVPPGFHPQGVMSMQMSLAGSQIKRGAPVAQLFEQLEEKLKQIPGVRAAGATSVLPLTSAISWGGFTIEEYTPPPNQPELQIDQRTVTPGYFPAMEVPLKEGRFCAASDGPEAPRVVIVDEHLARRFWPNSSAVGKRVKPGGRDSKTPWFTIIGVVGDVKQYGLEVEGRMVAYTCHKQQPSGGMWIVARTDGDPLALAPLMTRTIRSFDPNIVVFETDSMEHRLFTSLARQRFAMIMLAAFAGFALILAAVGIYGVMSYLVSQGSRDIGIRMALGAEQGRILGMVFRQGAILTAAGLGAGLIGAFGLTRVMATLLYGVSAADALTFSSVAVMLAMVALAASYIPARRATRVDPLVALRDE